MPDEDHEKKKGGAFRWFFKKFITAPAAWLGLAVGLGAGNAALGADIPPGGAVGMGILVGFAVGMLSFLIMHGIKASHQKALESGRESDADADANEKTVVESLRSSGQSDDADLLEKLIADRDAILKRCHSGQTENADATHTLELASAIVKESCRQAEELQDMVRRVEDPLLESPDAADRKIEGIRGDLRHAYQAVADAQSRLRRGDPLKGVDFLADAGSLARLNLSSLASQLEEETAMSRRVEERLRPKLESGGVVMDDPVESDGEAKLETE